MFIHNDKYTEWMRKSTTEINVLCVCVWEHQDEWRGAFIVLLHLLNPQSVSFSCDFASFFSFFQKFCFHFCFFFLFCCVFTAATKIVITMANGQRTMTKTQTIFCFFHRNCIEKKNANFSLLSSHRESFKSISFAATVVHIWCCGDVVCRVRVQLIFFFLLLLSSQCKCFKWW